MDQEPMKQINTHYLIMTLTYAALLAVIVVLADFGSDAWVFSVAGAVPHGDKVGHMVLAGILSFVANGTLRCRTVRFLSRPVLLGSAIVACLVMVEECSQLWITQRNVDIWDLLSDFAGIYLFGCLARSSMKQNKAAR